MRILRSVSSCKTTLSLLGTAALLAASGCGGAVPSDGVETLSQGLTSARWIWSSSFKANQWVAFRKTFSLSAKPSSAVTQIAADTKYWLYVNGQLVTFEGGLKRGPNPNDTYYDERDIASYLTSGSNTIAVLVWYFGKDGFSHKNSGAGGFLFQSDIKISSSTTRIASDTSWKVAPHSGYGENSSGSQPNYRLAESNIYYDARNAASMENWYSPSFNASGWDSATDKGADPSAPWNNLLKRPIPAFRYTGLTGYQNSAPSKGTDSTPIVMRLPSNLQVTPYLKVTANGGEVIGIQTDHYNEGDTGVRSTYIAKKGTQEFESLGWMSGTNVQYTIPSTVQIVSLKYRESGYDAEFSGSFTSSDSFFNTLWTKARRTLYLNMRDNFFDCPMRERAQWLGDMVNEQKQLFYALDTHAHALCRKAFNEVIGWQNQGVLYGPVPSGNRNADDLPQQTLATIHSLWNYYLNTGDPATVTSAYNGVKAYMMLWSMDSEGIVAHRAGGWDLPDWGTNIDTRLLDNVWYYLALDTMIRLAYLTGNTADLDVWQYRSNSISANFDSVFWNARTKEYRHPSYSGEADDRGNALTAIAGLVIPPLRSSVIELLRTHVNATPYTELYALQALYALGAVGTAEARMKARYAEMVNDPGYTLWEMFDHSGSDNHAWAGGPLFVLSAYAAGVRPTSAGYATYGVRPQLGSQQTLSATVPTVKGNVTVSVSRLSSTHLTMSLSSPSGTTATVGIPRIGMSSSTIKANGTTVYSNESSSGSVTGLSYLGNDMEYVYFKVTSGTWSFDESGSDPTYCAGENGYCTFSGTKLVRYGANGSYLYRVMNGDFGSALCSNGYFGWDPTPQVAKQCHVSSPIPVGGPPGFTYCAGENGTCSFTGNAVVVYGAYGSFGGRSFNGSAACNNATFGDLIPGVTKACYYAPEPVSSGWTYCADEGEVCSFPGTRMVAYGTNGSYFYAGSTGSVSCNNTRFGGDPMYGMRKGCYYR